jgi:oligopeptide transport system substrate-binding protein
MKKSNVFKANLASVLCGLLFTLSVSALSLISVSGCSRKAPKEPELNLVFRANVKGLDPAHTSDLYSATVIAQVYDSLLQYNYLKRPETLEPSLSELPEISADGKVYVFKLRKGIFFQDHKAFAGGVGRELVANDVIYSWKRLADPANTSEAYFVIDGKIKGLSDWAIKKSKGQATYETPVEGLVARDSHTLVVTLEKPYHQLSNVVAMPSMAIVPREAVEMFGAEFLNHPVGTGPFMLAKKEDWIRNSKISLVKNPKFRDETFPGDSGKKLPLVDKLVFHELPEEQPRWQTGLKGGYDWFDIPSDSFEAAIDSGTLSPELAGKGMKVDVSPAMDVTYVGINMMDPVLGKSKLVRQAMSLAFDSEDYIKRFMNGRGIKAHSPVPPGLAVYDPKFRNPLAEHNLLRAKKLLADAGYPEGKGLPEFEYESLADTKGRQQGEYFAQSMAKIGIRIRINSNSWPQLLTKLKERKATLFGLGWGAVYPDPQAFFMAFYSKNISPGPNATNFVNAEFDRLYEKSLTLKDSPARDAVYRELRDFITDQAVWIHVSHRLNYRVLHGWVDNFKWSEIALSYPKYIGVDVKKREQLSKAL